MEKRRALILIIFAGWQIGCITTQRLYWSGEFKPSESWHKRTMLPAPFTCKKDYDITVPAELRPRSNIGIGSWSVLLDKNLFTYDVQIWGKLAKGDRADTISEVRHKFTAILLLSFAAMTLLFIPIVLCVSKLISVVVFFIWDMLTHKVIRKFGRYLIIRSELMLRKREYENAIPDSKGVRRLRKRRFNLPTFFRSHPNEAVPEALELPKYSTFTLVRYNGFGSANVDDIAEAQSKTIP